MNWRLKKTIQCEKCPWKKDVDPYTIPNGYGEEKHAALECTIAKPGSLDLKRKLHVMECHETQNSYCIGWLHNQIGIGNNILLRIHMSKCENANEIIIIGEQHDSFQKTLPKNQFNYLSANIDLDN